MRKYSFTGAIPVVFTSAVPASVVAVPTSIFLTSVVAGSASLSYHRTS